ncbi:MAG: vWA domain-containing protein [Candidatus Promineifilaceae bacterium]
MSDLTHQRQIAYWRLLTALFGSEKEGASFEGMAADIAEQHAVPALALDSQTGIDTLLHRYPDLEDELNNCVPTEENDTGVESAESIRRALLYAKLLLNTFGPNTQTPTISAAQLSQWTKDVGHLEKALGFQPGQLRGRGTGASGTSLASEEQLRGTMQSLEKDLIDRMQLYELLKDDALAAQLTPSMALTEQLLREKGQLSGNALKNAKRLIQTFVAELADVLRLQIAQTSVGRIDPSVPPKRIFRNLDLQRTVWKNLVNWNPDQKKLYVDRLYYHHKAQKKLPTRMIVVVDQSGSMVDAMVQCAIIASIFAGLPDVDMHLIAFDTSVIDLTAWIHDPFEVLMRTDLGGGNDGPAAMRVAREKIREPQNTAMIWISDFYEFRNDQPLYEMIKAVHESGVHFLPVGSVSSSGYFSVNQWFRDRFKQMGIPLFSGSPKKLIIELKKAIA